MEKSNSGLSTWVNDQTSRAHGQAANQQRQVDPERERQVKVHGVRMKVNRTNAPNMGQQRHESNRREILREGQGATRDAFAPTDYDGSTVTSVKSHVQVEDSQVDTRGRPVGHPVAHDQHYFEDEDEEDEDQDDDQDDERVDDYDGEESRDVPHPRERALVVGYLDGRSTSQRSDVDPFNQPQPGDSYPPTTSGQQEDDEQEHEQYAFPPASAKVSGLDRAPASFLRPEPPVQRVTTTTQREQPLKRVSRQPNQPRQLFTDGRGITAQATPRTQQLAHRPLSPPATAISQRMQPLYPNPAPLHAPSIPPVTSWQAANAKTRSNSGNSNKALSQITALNHQPYQTVQKEPALDYDRKTLSEIPYKQLRDQAFDEGPAKLPSILSGEDAAKPLTTRLELVKNMDHNAKHTFMASLTLDEWDEAGDWFLERFGSIIGKMKDARKERRKLTKSFEEEILNRHESVQGKKRNIEEALAEMGKSGAGVLKAGTPKRTRT